MLQRQPISSGGGDVLEEGADGEAQRGGVVVDVDHGDVHERVEVRAKGFDALP